MHRRKGISPLVAVIMLIAFTLVVAGVVASWATTFASSQRQEIQFCADARVLIYRGDYSPSDNSVTLQIYNNGKVDLTFDAFATLKNATGPADIIKHPTGINVSHGEIESLLFEGITDDLEEITIQAERCPGTQDLIRYIDIYGMGR